MIVEGAVVNVAVLRFASTRPVVNDDEQGAHDNVRA